MRRFRHETPHGDMAALEFGDPAGRLAALWLHATGFNAMTYQSILAPLGLRTKVQALDLRGHGRTTLPAVPGKLKSWKRHRLDVVDFLERQSPTKPVVLAGHSMGATVALLVAGAVPDRVAGLVLVDPVILAPAYYRWMHLLPWMRGSSHMVRQARRRRDEFGSQKEILENYEQKRAFKTWREPFLSDYIIDGFDRFDQNEPDSDNQAWRLLCTPRFEAATFAAQRNRPWGALATVTKNKIPITILRPERDSVITDKVAMLLSRKCPHLILKERVNTTHFLPMEAPYDVRDQLSAYISSLIEGIPDTDVTAMSRRLRV
ncbi:MAG: alpha/beta hydrolase [Pseudomonadota bacterium]